MGFVGGDDRGLNGGTEMVNHLLQGSLKWQSNFAISFSFPITIPKFYFSYYDFRKKKLDKIASLLTLNI